LVSIASGHGLKITRRLDGTATARLARLVRRTASALAAAALPVLAACTSSETRRAQEQQVALKEIAAAETTATRAAALPSTGLWTEAHLLDRLVHAGVAPRVIADAPDGPKWMGTTPVVFLAGGGTLYAWIYKDSTARRAVTDALDPETGAPPGAVTPFAAPMLFVTQNNLAAVVTGGLERNQERVALALQAGLPVRPPPAP
jgi:hypothetical protein